MLFFQFINLSKVCYVPSTALGIEGREKIKPDPDPLLKGFNKLMEREGEREGRREKYEK